MKKIFILHGWTYSTEKWDACTALLIHHGVTCVQLKIPGLTEETLKVWDIDTYVAWLKEKLQGEGPAIILGHSNGGRIALAFAARYPEKLKCLILMDSAGILHNELLLRLKRFLFGTFARIGKHITSSEKARQLLYGVAGVADYRDANPIMRETMKNLIAVDLTPLLASIVTPTLIIWGGKDRTTPRSDGELMHRLIKNSFLHVIPDANHSPHATHPDDVSKIILEVLART